MRKMPLAKLHLSGTAAGVKAWEQLKLAISSNNAFENIFLRFLLCFCHKKQDWKIVWELFKINPFVPFLQKQVIAEGFGICLSQILPIKKYISGLDLTCSVDILLSIVRQMICLADSYFDNFPSEELKEKCWKFPVAFDILCACWANLYRILMLGGHIYCYQRQMQLQRHQWNCISLQLWSWTSLWRKISPCLH